MAFVKCPTCATLLYYQPSDPAARCSKCARDVAIPSPAADISGADSANESFAADRQTDSFDAWRSCLSGIRLAVWGAAFQAPAQLLFVLAVVFFVAAPFFPIVCLCLIMATAVGAVLHLIGQFESCFSNPPLNRRAALSFACLGLAVVSVIVVLCAVAAGMTRARLGVDLDPALPWLVVVASIVLLLVIASFFSWIAYLHGVARRCRDGWIATQCKNYTATYVVVVLAYSASIVAFHFSADGERLQRIASLVVQVVQIALSFWYLFILVELNVAVRRAVEQAGRDLEVGPPVDRPMRNRIFGGIGMALGSLVLIFFLLKGGPQGDGAFYAGQVTGLFFGFLLFFVGAYYALRSVPRLDY